jgi:hypothetical protein
MAPARPPGATRETEFRGLAFPNGSLGTRGKANSWFGGKTMRYETVHVCVDDSTIAAGDPWAVIEPVWWSANIYDGPDEYERSLIQFSRSQRLVFAVQWYRSEVKNGGHDQFYSNSTGIVWKDALEALRAFGASEFVSILELSAERLGGSPSLDRQERIEQLDTLAPNFNDLDDLFYDAEEKVDLDDRIIRFIRARPSDFYFEGKIRRAVLPGR